MAGIAAAIIAYHTLGASVQTHKLGRDAIQGSFHSEKAAASYYSKDILKSTRTLRARAKAKSANAQVNIRPGLEEYVSSIKRENWQIKASYKDGNVDVDCHSAYLEQLIARYLDESWRARLAIEKSMASANVRFFASYDKGLKIHLRYV